MSRAGVLILLGVLIILAPLSGFPMMFRSLVTIVCGAAVLSIGLAMRQRLPKPHLAEPTPEPVDEPAAPQPPAGVSPI
jgi:hypothetical protein